MRVIRIKARVVPQPCPYRATCSGACEWCETHSYSEACVPMLQQEVQRLRETPAGCEYCAGSSKLYQYTCNTKLYINTFGKARTIETECNPCPPFTKCSMNGIPARSAFIINYCPHCGRKLDIAE